MQSPVYIYIYVYAYIYIQYDPPELPMMPPFTHHLPRLHQVVATQRPSEMKGMINLPPTKKMVNMVKTCENPFLVGGFNPSEKYEFVNGKDYPIHYGK